MKEDKENTRPKEKKVEIKCEDGEKTEKSKEKKEAMTKVKLANLATLAAVTTNPSVTILIIVSCFNSDSLTSRASLI